MLEKLMFVRAKEHKVEYCLVCAVAAVAIYIFVPFVGMKVYTALQPLYAVLG